MSEKSDLLTSIDEVLLVGYGTRNDNGERICGLKDLFDLLKNMIVVATIIVGCLGIALFTRSIPGAEILQIMASLALLPLFILAIALSRLAFLIVERFPLYSEVHKLIRLGLLFLTFLLLGGLLAVGTTGLLRLTS